MVSVSFALLREGSSDDGLLPHLRTLLVRAGAVESTGASRPYSGSVLEQLTALMEEDGVLDVVFVHRDADARDAVRRRGEITTAAEVAGVGLPVIPVVPIQELEAWLITDVDAIRSVVGRPSGTSDLALPSGTAVERRASPKEVLRAALLSASGATGRRLHRESRQFAEYRRRLLERLDIDGPLRQLSAWQQLEEDIIETVQDLL